MSPAPSPAHLRPLRRCDGSLKQAILDLLCNDAWRRMPLSRIAKHLGTSRRYVQMVQADMMKARPAEDSAAERAAAAAAQEGQDVLV